MNMASPLLERRLLFLEQDPDNPALLADTAMAAFEADAFNLCAELIDRLEVAAELSPSLLNLKGLTALARSEFDQASIVFETLRAKGHDDAAIRFNLAWSRAMTGDFAAADELLDEAAIAVSPRGPALKIHAMHHLERYEDALALGHRLVKLYPDDRALMGALATLAMDAEETDLARSYAERAGDDPEGLAALGMLALGDQDAQVSAGLFDNAIAQAPQNPRAWIGKGLALLATGEPASAAEAIDRGAGLFGDHLGSWIASGWAHFISGANDQARQSFERALEIDPNFAESHGGLAVLEMVAGRTERARKHSEIALRLDRQSLGGALAKSMLLQAEGKNMAAERIREIALSMPIGPDGRTIAQALSGLTARTRR
jgi:tetratricopeptide (TPR) repeat protein